MRRGLAALLLLSSACIVAAHPPPPPPPPPPRVLTASEAVAVATQFARSRGLVVEYTTDARLDRNARWHVDVGGAGGRDRAVVVLDGFSGRVLKARLRGPAGVYEPPPAPPPPGTAPEPPPGTPPEPGTPPPPQGGPPPPPQGGPPPPPSSG